MNRFLEHLVEKRWRYFIATLAVLLLTSTQLLHMAFNGNVNVMFDPDDPYFKQLEQLNEQYLESEYAIVLFEPASKNVFSADSIQAIQELTRRLWELPYTVRVDSLTNHQRLSVNGDNLEVSDLLPPDDVPRQQQIDSAREYALSDSQIAGRLVSPNQNATALFASVALPEDHLQAVLTIGQQLTQLQQDMEQRYPGSKVYINGDIAVEHALLKVTMDDILRVNPMVFTAIFILAGVFLRSFMAIASTLVVVIGSTGIAAGFHVMLGFEINPITMMASAVIMVLAVADSVHVLTVYHVFLSQQKETSPLQAMIVSLRKNIGPVFWTSITTAVGFLGMNFGDSPPFRDMGNMAAIGVVCAFICTFTLLPAVALSIPVKPRHNAFALANRMAALGRWAAQRNGAWLTGVLLGSLVLASFIPQLTINDDISEYFDPSLPMHDAIQFARQNTNGVQTIHYSLDSGQENGIHQPAFLHKVEKFSNWLRTQPEVSGVTSYADLLKRISQTMNGNNPAEYRIPDSKELNAQYLLLYEMSLQAGMDLTRDLTMDRSALKLTVNVKDSDNATMIQLEQRIDDWLQQQMPELHTRGTSQLLMFAHMGTNIIKSMMDGSLFTLIFISLFMIFALRSLKLGLLSMIPNLFPPLVIYGIWAILVGQVNHAAAMTFSICLGLVVDDTIHFISKYRTARLQGLTPRDAIEQTFVTSGTAILITSVTLSAGVLLLSLSNFTVNDTMSLMLTGIILTALLFDLFLLPALLLWADRNTPFYQQASKQHQQQSLEPEGGMKNASTN